MTERENPTRQLSYIQQCLSNGKRPLGLFLGAGCPMAIRAEDGPLIPDIAGLTARVDESLSSDESLRGSWENLKKQFADDGRSEPTVEDALTHIRALGTVAGSAEVRGLSADTLRQLDAAICELILACVDKDLPESGNPYSAIAEWVQGIPREVPVEVFTTNYDLLLEQALERSRVPYFDGFTGVVRPFFDIRAMEEDMLPPRWARLWKLHGSINWHRIEGRGVFRSNPSDTSGVARVIHPSNLKYEESRRLPYLAMMDRLRSFLRRPESVLVLCGYSFRDEHINEAISQALLAAEKSVAFSLMFSELESYPEALALSHQCRNLSIIGRDGIIVGGSRSRWAMPDAGMPIEQVGLQSLVDEGNPETAKVECSLGDFAVLGEFVSQTVGSARVPHPGEGSTGA